MDECLYLYTGHITVYSGNIGKRQLTGKHHALKAMCRKPSHFFFRTVVGLGARVEVYWRQVHLQNAHILNKYGVNAHIIQPPYQLLGAFQLVIVNYSVYGHVHLCPKRMRVFTQLGDVAYRIARRLARPETLGTDIHSIGSMVDSRHAALKVPGRREKL